MYRIGEFSRITLLSIKTLRYYDSQGILSPSIRGDNQYRMYDENDYEKAILIRKLKQCGFTITEISSREAFLSPLEFLIYFVTKNTSGQDGSKCFLCYTLFSR